MKLITGAVGRKGRFSAFSYLWPTGFAVALMLAAGSLQAAEPVPSKTRAAVRVVPGHWKSTGLQVKRGQTITIWAAGTCRKGSKKWGPLGRPHPFAYRMHALRAKIGSNSRRIHVGEKVTFKAYTNGVLELGITYSGNEGADIDKAPDVTGGFNAEVKVRA